MSAVPPFRSVAAGCRVHWPILALVAALLAGIVAGAMIQIDTDAQRTIRAIETGNLNLARAFEEHTLRTIKGVDQAVLFVKFEYEKHHGRIDLAGYVRERRVLGSLFNQIGVIDEHGRYVLSSLPDHRPVDLSDREHFRVHIHRDSNQLFIGKPVLGRATGKWSIQMTRRINKPDGSFGGVVVISLDPQYFSNFYRGVALGRHGSVSLVGLDGIVRARRASGTDTVGQDVAASPLLAAARDSAAGTRRTESISDGRRRFYAYRVLAEYPLAVIVGVAEEEGLAGFHERRRGYLAYAAGLGLVVLAFGAVAIHLLNRQYRIGAELREARVRAESANRMKSEFLASMSHELRTPLNGIVGYAEYLRETLTGTGQEFAGIIFDSSRHLHELVDSILDLARIESGRLALAWAPEAPAALLEQLVCAHRPAADKKGLALALDVAPDLPELIECDRTRVLQILNNLVHNAIKFTDAGRVTIEAAPDRGGLRIAVSDTGCGIPADALEAVFERFRQIDDFLTRRHQGSGLGLALVRELVHLMGGRVAVESRPGEGSRFTVWLPERRPASPTPAMNGPQR